MNQTNVKVSFYLKKSESDADGYCPVMARLNIGKYSESAFSMKLGKTEHREILGVGFQHEAEGVAEDVDGRPGYGQECCGKGN